MYSASSAFHDAVANAAPQMALLIFEDAVFTNEDINVSNGIEFNDYFNTEEDLAIGQALSNEISFSIFNDNRLLNSYEFGEFLATIGAEIGYEAFVPHTAVYAESASNTWTATMQRPFVQRNGTAVNDQPEKNIKSVLIYDGLVYCFDVDGGYIVYNDSNGSRASGITVNSFMLDKVNRWEFKGVSYNKSTRILQIWQGSKKATYEFVPLGWFNAERPNVPDVNEIMFTCYDFMQKFEVDMPSFEELGLTVGTSTIGDLLIAICARAGVNYTPTEFINSWAVLAREPEEFQNVTMREVLQWIAEAASSNARIDRDGYLVLDWVSEARHTGVSGSTQTIDETGYSEFNPYWYASKAVNKLNNRASSGEFENIIGDGDEAYLIQDNPLLKGVI